MTSIQFQGCLYVQGPKKYVDPLTRRIRREAQQSRNPEGRVVCWQDLQEAYEIGLFSLKRNHHVWRRILTGDDAIQYKWALTTPKYRIQDSPSIWETAESFTKFIEMNAPKRQHLANMALKGKKALEDDHFLSVQAVSQHLDSGRFDPARLTWREPHTR